MKINVLFVSNQIRGINSQGGLGDVAKQLPLALSENNNIDIRLITPYFNDIPEDIKKTILIKEFNVPFGDGHINTMIYKTKLMNTYKNVDLYLIKADKVFNIKDSNGKIDKDSACKSIFLARAVIEFLKAYKDFCVDIIHCNDWYTGLIPVYINTIYKDDPYISRIAVLYTIHNIGFGYQGAFDRIDEKTIEAFSKIGIISDKSLYEKTAGLLKLANLPQELYKANQTHSIEHLGNFNFTKGGFAFADLINTVSINYAREIYNNNSFSGGFYGLAHSRRNDFSGIINGIDYDEWNPEKDSQIQPHNFKINDNIKTIINNKIKIRELIKNFSEEKTGENPFKNLNNDSILISVIGRITEQKFIILKEVLSNMLELKDIQLLILGQAHPKDLIWVNFINDVLEKNYKIKYKEKLLFYNGYDEKLSHQIYAASNMILMPSQYEPCGLTQLISMRYATIPIVRFTGGLKDTVVDEASAKSATGFGFKEDTRTHEMLNLNKAAQLLISTVRRAIEIYKNNPERWQELMINCMKSDFSWNVSSRQYMKLYNEAISRKVKTSFFN